MWEAPFVVFYEIWRLREVRSVVSYVSGRFWEAESIVFYVFGKLGEANFLVFTLRAVPPTQLSLFRVSFERVLAPRLVDLRALAPIGARGHNGAPLALLDGAPSARKSAAFGRANEKGLKAGSVKPAGRGARRKTGKT